MALGIALNGTLEMSRHCINIFDETKCFIDSANEKCFEKALEHENLVNDLNRQISEYLVEISSQNLNEDNTVYLNSLLYTIKDLERIGDRLLNVDNHFASIYENDEVLTDQAMSELMVLVGLIEETLTYLYQVIESPSRYLIDKLYGLEDEINRVEEEARIAFINRLKGRTPMGVVAMALYVDILSDFERVGDYAYNIASRLKENLF